MVPEWAWGPWWEPVWGNGWRQSGRGGCYGSVDGNHVSLYSIDISGRADQQAEIEVLIGIIHQIDGMSEEIAGFCSIKDLLRGIGDIGDAQSRLQTEGIQEIHRSRWALPIWGLAARERLLPECYHK